MKTTGLRLYGQRDLRLETFELPEIKDDEILASVVTDSLCMSSWKAANQGENHKKVPDDVAENPVLLGHEFCGEILEVGSKWQGKYKKGEKYVVQANLQLKDRPDCPGYTFPYTGGDATYIILAKEVMEQDCLLEYNGESYFEGSLIEPLSCVIGAFKANYHLIEGTYDHKMGIKKDGNLIILGGTGPMGYLAIDYALHGPVQPKKLVVTGRSQEKIDLLEKLYPKEEGEKAGVELVYVNTGEEENPADALNQLVDGNGYDDVFVFAPVQQLVEQGSAILATDGCFNFFAGPQNTDFKAAINFYDIHYRYTHYVGTSGGNTEDMREAVKLIEAKKVNVQKIVSHVLGLNDAKETTLQLPDIPGGKKLIYTHKDMPIKSLDEIMKDTSDPLHEILRKYDGLWSKEAEDYVLANQKEIQV
ncbi:zinc-binding dehydrogenase [Oceanobacillus jeddahense]|uniref:Zinc-binding dehydrogenase n=1 Tax=Oceanobacillus jeddahense TaxID=1462527 RepID=A0ABY5JWV8_9BACI|nr:zinc-binding dehydrogenase [Oceanobacillus jeddahense]UUI03054.1 zinc-binding dehydrogenase [Oceanobacillus jeddahense]